MKAVKFGRHVREGVERADAGNDRYVAGYFVFLQSVVVVVVDHLP